MTDTRLIYLIVVTTLALVMVAVICVLLVGLFDSRVDNKEVFTILGPAFQMIVGAFIGLVGGKVINDKKGDSQ